MGWTGASLLWAGTGGGVSETGLPGTNLAGYPDPPNAQCSSQEEPNRAVIENKYNFGHVAHLNIYPLMLNFRIFEKCDFRQAARLHSPTPLPAESKATRLVTFTPGRIIITFGGEIGFFLSAHSLYFPKNNYNLIPLSGSSSRQRQLFPKRNS